MLHYPYKIDSRYGCVLNYSYVLGKENAECAKDETQQKGGRNRKISVSLYISLSVTVVIQIITAPHQSLVCH